jgi:hypothetical protein
VKVCRKNKGGIALFYIGSINGVLDSDTFDKATKLQVSDISCSSRVWSAKVGKRTVKLYLDNERYVTNAECGCKYRKSVCPHVAAFAWSLKEIMESGFDDDDEEDIVDVTEDETKSMSPNS